MLLAIDDEAIPDFFSNRDNHDGHRFLVHIIQYAIFLNAKFPGCPRVFPKPFSVSRLGRWLMSELLLYRRENDLSIARRKVIKMPFGVVAESNVKHA
jgi:hypothetical protein